MEFSFQIGVISCTGDKVLQGFEEHSVRRITRELTERPAPRGLPGDVSARFGVSGGGKPCKFADDFTLGTRMNAQPELDPQLHSALKSIYEEVMWLSARPNVTPGRARAWYTHIMAEAVKRKLRCFTGKVSEIAAKGSVAR